MTTVLHVGIVYVCHRNRLYVTLFLLHMAASSGIIDCGDPGIPKNGQRHGTLNTVYTSEVRYSCISGYTLQGSDRRTCQSSGEWSGSVTQCNRRLIMEINPQMKL